MVGGREHLWTVARQPGAAPIRDCRAAATPAPDARDTAARASAAAHDPWLAASRLKTMICWPKNGEVNTLDLETFLCLAA